MLVSDAGITWPTKPPDLQLPRPDDTSPAVQQLFALVAVTLALNGLVVASLAWAYYAPRFSPG
jgi:hypothetical protein